VVEASRDHAKSWTFSYAWPLYSIQRVKEKSKAENIALISYSEDQAKKNLARVRKAIESTDSLKWLMPTSKAYVWESGMLNTSNDCTIESYGFGSSVRGGHFHKVIIDDPTKDHMSMSLQEQHNFFFGVILPALRWGGQLVVTGNTIFRNDLIDMLKSNPEFKDKVYRYPAITDGRPLWPEYLPIEALESKKRGMPHHQWSREYMLKLVSAADAKFKEEWIKYFDPEIVDQKLLFKIMTIDPAFSPGGDALAAVVTGTDTDDNTYVLDTFSFRGDFKSGLGQLCDLMLAHQPDRIGFETFAFQKMYKVLLEEEMQRRDVSFHIEEIGRDSKKTKQMRIESLQPKIARGKLFFRKDQPHIVDQLLSWDPVSKTNEDDEIDALGWQVGMWRKPYSDSAPTDYRPKSGTMGEALEEMRATSDDYNSKLFEDFR